MEQLTPELERRLQVEELWARRTVLAESMNALRRERFFAQHSLLTRFGTPVAAQQAPQEDAGLPDAPPPVEDTSAPTAGTRWPWKAAAAGAVAAMALLAASTPGVLAQAQGRLSVLLAQTPSPAEPPRLTQARRDTPVDIRAEVAARIAAALGNQPHTSDTLRALQSDPQAFDQTHPAP